MFFSPKKLLAQERSFDADKRPCFFGQLGQKNNLLKCFHLECEQRGRGIYSVLPLIFWCGVLVWAPQEATTVCNPPQPNMISGQLPPQKKFVLALAFSLFWGKGAYFWVFRAILNTFQILVKMFSTPPPPKKTMWLFQEQVTVHIFSPLVLHPAVGEARCGTILPSILVFFHSSVAQVVSSVSACIFPEGTSILLPPLHQHHALLGYALVHCWKISRWT